MTTAAKEATDAGNSNGESCGQWWRWQRKLRTTTSGAKEASDMFVDDKGSCDLFPQCWKELHMKATMLEGTAHESYNDYVHEGSDETRVTKYLRFMGWGLHEGSGVYCYYLLCLVGLIEPTKLLFKQTRVDHLIQLLAWGAQHLGSSEHLGSASLKHVTQQLCEAQGPF